MEKEQQGCLWKAVGQLARQRQKWRRIEGQVVRWQMSRPGHYQRFDLFYAHTASKDPMWFALFCIL